MLCGARAAEHAGARAFERKVIELLALVAMHGAVFYVCVSTAFKQCCVGEDSVVMPS